MHILKSRVAYLYIENADISVYCTPLASLWTTIPSAGKLHIYQDVSHLHVAKEQPTDTVV